MFVIRVRGMNSLEVTAAPYHVDNLSGTQCSMNPLRSRVPPDLHLCRPDLAEFLCAVAQGKEGSRTTPPASDEQCDLHEGRHSHR